jgi:hypothetical protein
MADIELINRSIRFDPALDLEAVAELPGKDVMQDILRRLEPTAKCSSLIQDSHGWCFYIRSGDHRIYLVELGYKFTEGEASWWALSCFRSMGWRIWELFSSQTKGVGDEWSLLKRTESLLSAHHGFERNEDWPV